MVRNMQSEHYVNVDDELVQLIKRGRKEKGFTQEEMATMLGISSKKYSRLENKSLAKIEKKLLRELAKILNINFPEYTNNYLLRCSFSIEKDLKNDLEFFKMSKGFESLSDAIKYCVRQVLDDFYLKKVSVQLTDEIKEVISNTYLYDLERLSKENEIQRLILKKIEDAGAIDIERIRKEIDEIMLNVSRADKY